MCSMSHSHKSRNTAESKKPQAKANLSKLWDFECQRACIGMKRNEINMNADESKNDLETFQSIAQFIRIDQAIFFLQIGAYAVTLIGQRDVHTHTSLMNWTRTRTKQNAILIYYKAHTHTHARTTSTKYFNISSSISANCLCLPPSLSESV